MSICDHVRGNVLFMLLFLQLNYNSWLRIGRCRYETRIATYKSLIGEYDHGPRCEMRVSDERWPLLTRAHEDVEG